MKTLVVYYSRKGYTEKIALAKAKELSADFLCLETIENVAGYNGFINCITNQLTKRIWSFSPTIPIFPHTIRLLYAHPYGFLSLPHR